ncbi:MAG: 1,2-phenylacetyl-CoA epoxidase subunit PaaD [Saprospiraceae bacterium]
MPLTKEQVFEWLEDVCDPEIPVLSVLDLGIVRGVNVDEGEVEVLITPTYSGCPAMNTIGVNIKAVLQEKGVARVKVSLVLSPAWTTDWIGEAGRKKLLQYGIAPPQSETVDKNALFQTIRNVPCPLCGSKDTEMISQFGSTACKSLFRCRECREPFDYFKCH